MVYQGGDGSSRSALTQAAFLFTPFLILRRRQRRKENMKEQYSF